MSMRTMTPGDVVRCPACRANALKLRNLKGRAFSLRDEDELVLDVDLKAPACGACGEVFIKGAVQKKFSDALERLYLARKREAVVAFLAVTDERFHLPRHQWESLLGVSPGYLSRLLRERRVPSTSLEVVLRAVARDPIGGLRMLSYTRKLPKELEAMLA